MLGAIIRDKTGSICKVYYGMNDELKKKEVLYIDCYMAYSLKDRYYIENTFEKEN